MSAAGSNGRNSASTSKVAFSPAPPAAAVQTTAAALSASGNRGRPISQGSLRTSQRTEQALQAAKLDNPFDHRMSDYHSSQQASLNAELRAHVEKVTMEWEKVVQSTRTQIEQLPERASAMSYVTFSGIQAYDEGYGCTDDAPMSAERLVDEFKLKVQVSDMNAMLDLPPVQVGQLGSVLDNLKDSLKPLTNQLDSLRNDISPLDKLTELDVSTAAVALHERYHFPVAEQVRQQLTHHAVELQEMEDAVESERSKKDIAIRGQDIQRAAECLTRQVELGNEMLKNNHLRTELTALCENDVAVYDADTRSVLNTVREISIALDAKVHSLLNPVAQDLQDVRRDLQEAKKKAAATVTAVAKEQSDAKLKFREMEMEEQSLWKQLCETYFRLEKLTVDKKNFAWQRLLAKERSSRQQMVERELVHAQELHITKLELLEDRLQSALRASELFATFASEFDIKLTDHLNKTHEELYELKRHEAAEYVRRYEGFAFAAEEARVKRQSRLDAMALSRRTLEMDVESATHTLDPNVKKYNAQRESLIQQSAEVSAYLAHLEDIQRERKDAVSDSVALIGCDTLLKSRPGTSASQTGMLKTPVRLGTSPKADSTSHSQDLPEMHESTAMDQEEEPNVVHPQVAARTAGIQHEESATERAQDYVRQELAAIESRMSDIRRQRAELTQSRQSNPTPSPRAGNR